MKTLKKKKYTPTTCGQNALIGGNDMKRYRNRVVLVISLCCLLLVACGKNGQGTYYPGSVEMAENLESAGYIVTVTENFYEEYTGTCLFAEKGTDYIEFYWLNETDAVPVISQELENRYTTYNKLVSAQNDSKWGTFIFCGTDDAVEESGINIVDVKVEVN